MKGHGQMKGGYGKKGGRKVKSPVQEQGPSLTSARKIKGSR